MAQERSEVLQGTWVTLRRGNDRASLRRTLDERLLLRFPSVYRWFARGLSRLPSGSRVRRLLLARRVQRAYAAANRRDFDLVLLGWDDEAEYRPGADLIAPDQESVFIGRDGYLRMWGSWLGAFDDLRFEPEEMVDFGDVFLVTAQQSGHGSGSGVAVSKPVFQLFKTRGGMVIQQCDFSDHSEAVRAVEQLEGRESDRRTDHSRSSL
jgi:ketosteroid isomerase-like protein